MCAVCRVSIECGAVWATDRSTMPVYPWLKNVCHNDRFWNTPIIPGSGFCFIYVVSLELRLLEPVWRTWTRLWWWVGVIKQQPWQPSLPQQRRWKHQPLSPQWRWRDLTAVYVIVVLATWERRGFLPYALLWAIIVVLILVAIFDTPGIWQWLAGGRCFEH